MKKICAIMALLLLLNFMLPIRVGAEAVSKPQITSGNKICVLNLETKECPMNIGAEISVPVTVTAKMMTALVVYDSVDNLTVKVTVPMEATLDTYIGPMGLISAPRLGLTPGKEYSVKDLLYALMVSSSNDAGITLAYYVGNGDISAFVTKMNEKAKAIGAKNTEYFGCVGLDDGSHTTAYDSALIAAEYSKNSTLLDISSAGKAITTDMGTLHNKNYLTSDYLIRGLKLPAVKGICAGQANEENEYCLIAYYFSNELSYIICVMGGSGEKRNTSKGTRWFETENAYADVHKIVPWLSESFVIKEIISPKTEEFSFSIPVKLSAKKDSVMTVPTESVSFLTDITAEKVNYVAEPTFYQASLEAPVEEGAVVGEVRLYKDGVVVATVPLVTKESAEKGEIVAIMDEVDSFLGSTLMWQIIRIIILLAIVFAVWSFGCFIFRIIKKYRNGMSKDYYPPTD